MNIDKIYLDFLIILNDSVLSYEKRTELLYEIFKENKIIERIFVTFLIQFNKPFFWEHVKEFDCSKYTDVVWYLNFDDINFDKVVENQFLVEVYNAKGYLNSLNHSGDFDFDILILLNQHEHKINASLDFEFICSSCKHSHPIFDTRCPHCHNILTLNVRHRLTKSFYTSNQSLQ